MEYQVLDKRDGVYIVMRNSKVFTVSKDDYMELKLEHYNGNRIFYEFSDGISVQETYDDRIFNCHLYNVIINVRDGNAIARLIRDKNEAGFIELVKQHYYTAHRIELLEKILDTYGDRVVKIKGGYVIDDIFMVDDKGTSYYKNQSQQRTLKHFKDKNEWKFLCTVAQRGVRRITMDTEVGVLELDETCMTILAKIGFFCNPNIKDSVFMNQLPNKIQKLLRDEYGGVRK